MTLFRLSLLLLLLLASIAPARAEDPSPAEVEKIQKIVRDYLKQHPEVVVDALQDYQNKQEALKADKTRQTGTGSPNPFSSYAPRSSRSK